MSRSILPDSELTGLVHDLRAVTGSEHACLMLVEKDIVQALLSLLVRRFTDSRINPLAEEALDVLINVASYEESALKVANLEIYEGQKNGVLWKVIEKCNSAEDKVWCNRCIDLILNLSRVKKSFVTSPLPIDDINKLCQTADGTLEAMMESVDAIRVLANLCQDYEIGKIILEKASFWEAMYVKFCSDDVSEIWKYSAVATVKNITKSSYLFHEAIIEQDDMFCLALLSLMTPGTFSTEELPKCPLKLTQANVKIDEYKPFRMISLQTLFALCTTTATREKLRDLGIYTIVKGLALSDIDDDQSELCLDIINILIRTEEEIGVDNLETVHIPPDIVEKFTSNE